MAAKARGQNKSTKVGKKKESKSPARGRKASRGEARESTVTVYIRIAADVKKKLEDYAGASGETESKIIAEAMRYFMSLPDDLKQEIMDQGFRSPYTFFTYQAWADHAFSKQRWSWAIEWLQIIEREAAKLPSKSLYQSLQYRQGFAWIRFGKEIRREAWESAAADWDGAGAHQDIWANHLGAAEKCFNISRKYFSRYHSETNTVEKNYPVISYNLACLNALMAALSVERVFPVERLRDALEQFNRDKESRRETGALSLDDPGPPEWFWMKHGADWREILEELPAAIKVRTFTETDEWAGRAMDELNSMSSSPESEDGSDEVGFWMNIGPLVRHAVSDPDLIFLKEDNRCRNAWTEWSGLSSGSLLDSFDYLFRSVPAELLE